MKLFNSLTHKLEEFSPINKGKVGMYVCGPTVYDRPHIGNARSVVVYDVLYRILTYIYGKENVCYVRNITDVDDKINARAKELGITIQELTSKTYEQFASDMAYLGCQNPNFEPKATEHIDNIIDIIEILIQNGHAYQINNHVYFDITSDPNYGELSGRKIDDMIAGARIGVKEDKKNPGDFVLWKPASEKDDKSSVFESPWGRGRPGWHIECSAMSRNFLGENFDIHGGGADLIFPHHTNEIAQSTCAFEGSHYAKYWVHNGFLTVNKEKMSKSLGNFLTIGDFIDKELKGEVLRCLFLTVHYRKPLDYSEKLLHDAKERITYLYRSIEGLEPPGMDPTEEFINHLKDDMNMSEAFAYLGEIAKKLNKAEQISEKNKYASILKSCANLIGFLTEDPSEFLSSKKHIDSEYVETMIKKRLDAKANKDYELADAIRLELQSNGIELEDKPDGTTHWKK